MEINSGLKTKLIMNSKIYKIKVLIKTGVFWVQQFQLD